MTDQVTQESYPVPDPTVVDPCPATVRNGQCAPDGFTNHNHQQAKTPTEPESFTVGQEMKITDTVEGEGNLTHLWQVWGCIVKVMDAHVRVCVRALWGWDGYFYSCEIFLVCSLNNK